MNLQTRTTVLLTKLSPPPGGSLRQLFPFCRRVLRWPAPSWNTLIMWQMGLALCTGFIHLLLSLKSKKATVLGAGGTGAAQSQRESKGRE